MCCRAGREHEREGAVPPAQVFVPREDLSLDVIKQYRVVRACALPRIRRARPPCPGAPCCDPAQRPGIPRRLSAPSAVAEGAVQ